MLLQLLLHADIFRMVQHCYFLGSCPVGHRFLLHQVPLLRVFFPTSTHSNSAKEETDLIIARSSLQPHTPCNLQSRPKFNGPVLVHVKTISALANSWFSHALTECDDAFVSSSNTFLKVVVKSSCDLLRVMTGLFILFGLYSINNYILYIKCTCCGFTNVLGKKLQFC